MRPKAFRAASFVFIGALAATACRPTDPQPVATIDGRELKSATCTNSILTPTQVMCREALLKKCKPGAEVLNISEGSRLVYQHPGWATQYIWTVMLKDC